MRIIHGVMALLIVSMLGFGLWIANLPQDYPDAYKYFNLHKSFGIVALLFALLRISVRMRSRIPDLPYQIKQLDENLAQLIHYLLYILMLTQPLSGYAMSVFSGHPVLFFSYEMPNLVGKDAKLGHLFLQIHSYGGYIMVIAVCLHVLGSIKHYLVDHINLFKRIY